MGHCLPAGEVQLEHGELRLEDVGEDAELPGPVLLSVEDDEHLVHSNDEDGKVGELSSQVLPVLGGNEQLAGSNGDDGQHNGVGDGGSNGDRSCPYKFLVCLGQY